MDSNFTGKETVKRVGMTNTPPFVGTTPWSVPFLDVHWRLSTLTGHWLSLIFESQDVSVPCITTVVGTFVPSPIKG